MENFKEAYSRYQYATSNINARAKKDYEIDSDNVTHRINADGDHEFKGDYQHKIIKKNDTEGLDNYLKHIHDNVLGHGNSVRLNAGTSEAKSFYGGTPGVDKLKQTILGDKKMNEMKSFSDFLQTTVLQLSEEIHQEIKKIMNDDSYNRSSKLNRITKKLRDLNDRGEDSGIENSTPKKGSSRAVFFPKEDKPATVDGKPVKLKSAVKIAFKGTLDPYTGSHKLLGEHQNEVESDHLIRDTHGMLSRDHEGNYHTNEHGVLAPVLDHHHDDHWIEMGHARNMSKADFRNATKTEKTPKGLDFDHFHNHIMNQWDEAHGRPGTRHVPESAVDDIESHPLHDNVMDFIHNTDNHPADLVRGNWGIWRHPVTGKEHPVIRDYGFSKDISKLYHQASKNKYKW